MKQMMESETTYIDDAKNDMKFKIKVDDAIMDSNDCEVLEWRGQCITASQVIDKTNLSMSMRQRTM